MKQLLKKHEHGKAKKTNARVGLDLANSDYSEPRKGIAAAHITLVTGAGLPP